MTGSVNNTCATLDADALVAIAAARDARSNRNQARARWRDARKDRIRRMRAATKKLHEMADNTLYKGLLKATPALCDLASKAVDKAAGLAGAVGCGGTIDTGMAKSAIAFVAKAATAADQVDPFGIINSYKQAAKSKQDCEAEVAAQRVRRAEEDAGEGQRLERSMTTLAQKIQESRHAAAMAAARA